MQVDALSEVEPVEFPSPVGTLEAFHTGGGISTLPFAYQGKIDVMEYKTLRYPGHAAVVRPIRELGLLANEPIEVKGKKVSPARRVHRSGSSSAVQTRGTRPCRPTGAGERQARRGGPTRSLSVCSITMMPSTASAR